MSLFPKKVECSFKKLVTKLFNCCCDYVPSKRLVCVYIYIYIYIYFMYIVILVLVFHCGIYTICTINSPPLEFPVATLLLSLDHECNPNNSTGRSPEP